MEKKEIVCIACPIGCRITIRAMDKNIISTQGNSCPKGIEYIKEEYFNPLRILTTTVKVIGGESPLVSVKTEKAIPKGLLLKAMFETANIEVEAPLEIGQIIKDNLVGIGVKLIATRSVKRKF